MLKKIDNALFGNTSRKIECITKIIVVALAVIGFFILIMGIMGIATYASYGLADADVVNGIVNVVTGLFMIFGGYWLGALALGFAKVVRNAEYETFLDEELFEFEDECAACTLDSCEGCEVAADVNFEIEATDEDKAEAEEEKAE